MFAWFQQWRDARTLRAALAAALDGGRDDPAALEAVVMAGIVVIIANSRGYSRNSGNSSGNNINSGNSSCHRRNSSKVVGIVAIVVIVVATAEIAVV